MTYEEVLKLSDHDLLPLLKEGADPAWKRVWFEVIEPEKKRLRNAELMRKWNVTDGDLFGIQQSADTLRSRNVAAFIPGYDKKLKDKYVVVCARLDNLGTASVNVDGENVMHTYYGANGNASGLAMLLQLASRLQTNKVLLGRQIRDARTEAGLSQKAVGEMIGVPQSRVSLMEKGAVDESTTAEILRLIAERAARPEKKDAPAEEAKKPAE